MRLFRWNELRILAEAKGFRFDQHRGDHYISVIRPEIRSQRCVLLDETCLRDRITSLCACAY